MKIAVITAIFGGMDTPKPFAAQSVECDRIVITEENTRFPIPNLPPRLQAKYFKLQAHRVWPFYDAYVWIDGNIEIKHPDFVKIMTENLYTIRIQAHHERKTIREEIEFILASDNPYLTTRYGSQPLKREYEYYLALGMSENALLYSCNLFAYEKTELNALFFNKWWDLVLRWSWFDQSAFSFLTKLDPYITPFYLGEMFDNPYFTLHPHDNWQQ